MAAERTIVRLESCTSTNDVLKAMARDGSPEGTVVVAGEQTAGRGTKGRPWHSPPGLGLYASILLRPDPGFPLTLLPLAAGLAAREAVGRTSGLALRVRWPNDLVAGGRKIGGVLCEGGVSGGGEARTIVGLGLNLRQKDEDFPPPLRGRAGSVESSGGRPAEPAAVLLAFLAALDARTESLRRGGGPGLVEEFTAASETPLGGDVFVEAPEGRIDGRFAGIEADGALRLETAEGTRRLTSAEILGFGRNRV